MLSRNNGGYCAMCSTQKSISKIKQTCIDRYGVENPFQSEQIKDKIKQVNLERFGYESHNKSNKIKEKKRQSILQRYGVIHQMYIPEVKSKTNMYR
jgi:ethanolamine utilization protein EutQ (cupin superfamily)